MEFKLIIAEGAITVPAPRTAYLTYNNWDDYGYRTTMGLIVCNKEGELKEIGSTKIGYIEQVGTREVTIWDVLYKITKGQPFAGLEDKFFSLGSNAEYYKNLYDFLGKDDCRVLLRKLKDVVMDPGLYSIVEHESVFIHSLLREVSVVSIKGQYSRILDGGALAEDYNFAFNPGVVGDYDFPSLKFMISASSFPDTHIHALIGRNGSGKTSLMREMVKRVIDKPSADSGFVDLRSGDPIIFGNNHFASLIYISFGAFDKFGPVLGQNDIASKNRSPYRYIGLKKPDSNSDGNLALKDLSELIGDFVNDLETCFGNNLKLDLWMKYIQSLGFEEEVSKFKTYKPEDWMGDYLSYMSEQIAGMSSGHSMMLFVVTALVSRLEEKTLVLFDEPETHLHPPMLSVFMSVLSDLLRYRNAVALIATHSPVVLQEIPKVCVKKIFKSGDVIRIDHPEIETYGENVGTLTREVFGLEVSDSGYNLTLKQLVDEGKSYEQIISIFSGQIGFEARASLRALINYRYNIKNND